MTLGDGDRYWWHWVVVALGGVVVALDRTVMHHNIIWPSSWGRGGGGWRRGRKWGVLTFPSHLLSAD